MKHKTWKVISWESKPEGEDVTAEYAVTCDCGVEAMLPVSGVGVRVEAMLGMGFFFDPSTPTPSWFKPDHIKCRTCSREYLSH